MALANRLETHAPRNSAVGVGMYLLAAFMFAVNGVFAKTALESGLSAMRLTEFRNGGSMVLLVIFVALTNRSAFRVSRKELPFLIGYGVIAFTLVQFLYFFTISRLPLGIGTLLGFLAPVLVALYFKFVRHQTVSNGIWFAIALTLIGLSLVAQVWQGLTLDFLGVLSGLGLALALSAYWIMGESGQEHRDGVSLTMWAFIFSTIAWSIIAPWWTFPWGELDDRVDVFIPGLPVWLIMLYVVVLGTIIPFLLVLGSLRRIGAQRAGIVGTSEPIFAALLAMAFLGEMLTPIQGIGGIIVISGIIVAELSRPQHITPGEFPQTDEE